MKSKIINYFKNDRTYRGGVSLIQQLSPKLGLKKQLNIHPESDYLKGCVFEELRELADLKISELNAILAIPIPKISKPSVSADPIPVMASKMPPKEEISKIMPVVTQKRKTQPVKKVSRKK